MLDQRGKNFRVLLAFDIGEEKMLLADQLSIPDFENDSAGIVVLMRESKNIAIDSLLQLTTFCLLAYSDRTSN